MLEARADEAIERARRTARRVIASVTVPLPAGVDVAACVFGTRRAEERYFVWEQPDRDGFALGGIGAAWTVEGAPSRGRFAAAAAECIEVTHRALAGPDDGGLPASGPVWAGLRVLPRPRGGGRVDFPARDADDAAPGCSCATATVRPPQRASCARPGRSGTCSCPGRSRASSRCVPMRFRWSIPTRPADTTSRASCRPSGTRRRSRVWRPGSAPAASRRSCSPARFRCARPCPSTRARCSRAYAPAIRVASVIASALRGCIPWGQPGAFGAAEGAARHRRARGLDGPQRRSGGRRPSRRALAAQREGPGGAPDRGGDDRARAGPLSVWVAAAEEPGLVHVANVQHLATPIRGQLAESHGAIELAGRCIRRRRRGEPWPSAAATISELERPRSRVVRRPGRLGRLR